MKTSYVGLRGLPELTAEIDHELSMQAVTLLHAIGERCVEVLQTQTSVRRPPAYRGGPDRWALYGGWANVSGDLAKNYFYKVSTEGGGSNVQVGNRDPEGYGAILELRDGFFVIRGIDDQGGLIEQTMRQVVNEYTDWDIRNG